MPVMVETADKIHALEGLLSKRGLDERERQFVQNLASYRSRGNVGKLSDKQVVWMDALYARHFG